MTISLTPEQLDDLREAAGRYEHAEVRAYSGRAMYGAYCLGLTASSAYEAATIVGIAKVPLPEPRIDNMGLDVIAYWPNVAPPAPDD